MNKEIEYSAQARTNPVFLTAKTAVCLMAEIISGMCHNGIIVTGLQEFDYDLSGNFSGLDHSGFPLSMIIQGQKLA
ncbi:MAG: hypothetical protein IKE58_00580 [Blautia sp.]|nr:hypothetical protein [Blautia sp.]